MTIVDARSAPRTIDVDYEVFEVHENTLPIRADLYEL